MSGLYVQSLSCLFKKGGEKMSGIVIDQVSFIIGMFSGLIIASFMLSISLLITYLRD